MRLEHVRVFKHCVVNVLPLNALEDKEKIPYYQILAKGLSLLTKIDSRRGHLHTHLFEILMELLLGRPRRSLG